MTQINEENYLHLNEKVLEVTEEFTRTWKMLNGKSFWPIKIFAATNLFLWHLNAFAKNDHPVPLFVEAFKEFTKLLKISGEMEKLVQNYGDFSEFELNNKNFENSCFKSFQ